MRASFPAMSQLPVGASGLLLQHRRQRWAISPAAEWKSLLISKEI